MAKQYDILFRLLLLGDSGVGKTCMLRRFTEGEFDPSHISTIAFGMGDRERRPTILESNRGNVFCYGGPQGVDFKMKTLEIDGIKVRVQIWDTAGQERYHTITKQYYRRAQGIVFVYDITSELSFHHIGKWASDVDEFSPDKVQSILVGNKADEELRRKVTKDQGSKLAEAYGMEFFETSASTSNNINESFMRVTELVLQAHKRDVANLLGSLDDYLDRVTLEEDKGSQDDDAHRTCAC